MYVLCTINYKSKNEYLIVSYVQQAIVYSKNLNSSYLKAFDVYLKDFQVIISTYNQLNIL